MQITVELQDAFSYVPLLLFFLAAIAGVLLILLWPKKKATAPSKPQPVKPQLVPPQNLASLKHKYDSLLVELFEKRSKNKLSDREAFQELSKIVRNFAFATTGIRVQNYTLSEIKAANLPRLYELIAECYVPEFAKENNDNIYEAINKARKVVGEWN